ncbi:hypothetical protein [Deinococcus aquatilis]|nr:hypothetical protein [Deinococcus aquatilis]
MPACCAAPLGHSSVHPPLTLVSRHRLRPHGDMAAEFQPIATLESGVAR